MADGGEAPQMVKVKDIECRPRSRSSLHTSLPLQPTANSRDLR